MTSRFTLSLLTIACATLFVACGEDNSDSSSKKAAEEIPAVGTNINTLVKPTEKPSDNPKVRVLGWEELELPGQGVAEIIKKYQTQIDAIAEGGPKEKILLKKIQAEMNDAPVNPKLNGLYVKLPGFVSPLEVDQKKGIVKEFLLVPYFGACIHVPPPPMNQTLLIKPKKGQGISIDATHIPVWVTGKMVVDSAVTDLAEAGYQIINASIEEYREEDGGN